MRLNKVTIGVETYDADKLERRLKSLVSTKEILLNIIHPQDSSYSQIYLITTKTLNEMCTKSNCI